MSPYVKSLMNETGKSEKEVSTAWRKAQVLTADNFGVDVEDFERKQYEYAVQTAKRLLGFQEKSEVKAFYESDKSAADFIEEAVMTSGDVGVDLDHATMRGRKGSYKGDGENLEVEMDDEEEERSSKEYDTVSAFNEPNSTTEEEMGEPVDHEDGPEYDENEEY